MSNTERWLLVSDVDDTLLGGHGPDELSQALQSASDRVIIAYNSSRPCASLRTSLTTHPDLLTPDYLIGGLGTEIQEGYSQQALTDYTQYLSSGLQRDLIYTLLMPLGFTLHSSEFQTPLKLSYAVPNKASYEEVLRRLDEASLPAKVIFSGGQHLDIIPSSAGKGNVIRYLMEQLHIDPSRVVVAGDSGNDLDMFRLPFIRGIVVGNADSALKQMSGNHIYHAQASYAEGVLEGLRFWKTLPSL